jgi:2',3'-cyclic-nucleotide 2'-phosphodiesterase (5'-nucleotidase family)
MRRLCALLVLATATALAQTGAESFSRAHSAAQAAADVIREAAGADAAFLPAGLLKEGSGDLSSMMQYPTDEIVVVALKGSQVRAALERSLANYPQPNGAFLQISGLLVTFSESAAPESRILDIRVGDAPLSADRQYQVAMPVTLARGALGYFKIWERTSIAKSLGTTLEGALKGKTGAVRASRYIAKP